MDYSTLLPQIKSLHAQIPKKRILPILIRTLFKSHSLKKTLAYRYLTVLLWEYIAEILPPSLLNIPEFTHSSFGHVVWNKRQVSLELASAILDFHAITSELSLNIQSVLAIGANQWQLGYVFLRHLPQVKYIIADAPQALAYIQKELGTVFPEKKVFSYRHFSLYEEVAQDFETSSICCIDLNQLPLLPPRSIDLGFTIGVLDKLSKMEVYGCFDRMAFLIKDYFYFKEQKISTLKEADYPVPDGWEEIFWRTCSLYPNFFEALFQVAR